MKARVLMARRTGELFEAYRITFLDQLGLEPLNYNVPWRLVSAECNGYIVVLPKKISPYAVYFNPAGIKKMFEDLGEL